MTDKTLVCKKGNHVSGEGYSHVIMNQIIREDLTSVFLITAADSSLAFRMTSYRPLLLVPYEWSKEKYNFSPAALILL